MAKNLFKQLREKAREAVGPEGFDLRTQAVKVGQQVNRGWGYVTDKVGDIINLPTHEKRIAKLEAEIREHAKDIRDLKLWLLDVDNRTRLHGLFLDCNFEEIQCEVCNRPMRVKQNREDGSFFLGCSDFPNTRHPARGITMPDSLIMARKFQVV